MECEEILKSKFGNNQEVFLQGYCKQANIENCDKTYIDFIPSSLKQFGIEVAMPEIQKKLLAEVTWFKVWCLYVVYGDITDLFGGAPCF